MVRVEEDGVAVCTGLIAGHRSTDVPMRKRDEIERKRERERERERKREKEKGSGEQRGNREGLSRRCNGFTVRADHANDNEKYLIVGRVAILIVVRAPADMRNNCLRGED